ncbi:MAG: ribonuclease HII [Candidatus Cardinium sp.]|uniref:ribonuclease HII n=1 Tax=Candidatus Cardinium sp. TP TaxID=2961955 RepID=UPI0021AF5907|nr:ribonuclease HII [Candidatus Cardinium sp. TP]MCT4697370.1 ribonuclease HII [Candidatus Cardinium sp. TP]MDN5247290.1 ribonuclease HII [Candidatus Cardinium sp.]
MVRLHKPLLSEYQYYHVSHIAGCDHAGAGAIAGPIVGAAVILPHAFYNEILGNTQTLTIPIHLYGIIQQHAVAWSIAMVDHIAIHSMGIPNAAQLAIHNALDQLKTLPNLLLVSGRSFDGYKTIPHQCIPQGDKIYTAISAANILAKVYRDRYMEILDKDFPAYGWKKNKGYATPAHKQVIKQFGGTLYHRKNFNKKEK